jgi:hypothetical protein
MTAFDRLKQSTVGIFSNLLNRIIVSIVAIAVLAVLWIGYHFLNPAAIYQVQTTTDVRNLIVSTVQADAQLTTAKTTVKATVVVRRDDKILNLPVGQTNLVYEGVGTVRAGLDFTKLDVVALDLEQHRVKISLPAPSIADVSLDLDRSSTLASYRNWFGAKAGVEIYETAQRQAIAKIKQEACANGILDVANGNAKQLIQGILTNVGFEAVEVDTQALATNTCPIEDIS